MRTVVLIGALFVSLPLHAAVEYVQTYQNLPDYDKDTPFRNPGGAEVAKLKALIENVGSADLKSMEQQCDAGSVLVWEDPEYRQPLTTDICNLSKFLALKKQISAIAPSLSIANMTLWITDLSGRGSKDLIVGHIDISKDDSRYPYLSLWRIKLDGGFKAYYAGPFLSGKLHAVRFFGNDDKSKVVFISHLSCIECEPVTYLTAMDFDAGEDARPYEFTYSEKHGDFDPTIEYELPGMGHTVDAQVEVRVLPPSTSGPHLLQHYKMEEGEGPDEWWSFTCKDYKCDYQEFKQKAPADFMKFWDSAVPL